MVDRSQWLPDENPSFFKWQRLQEERRHRARRRSYVVAQIAALHKELAQIDDDARHDRPYSDL